jgi:hypothetical protein
MPLQAIVRSGLPNGQYHTKSAAAEPDEQLAEDESAECDPLADGSDDDVAGRLHEDDFELQKKRTMVVWLLQQCVALEIAVRITTPQQSPGTKKVVKSP